MECAKDIVLELKKGQATDSSRKGKRGLVRKCFEKITKHKIMTTIVLATISFMILDVVLIASFVSVLTI